MKKLTRKWRKSQEHDDLSLPTRDDSTLDDNRPMDTQEQEEMVRSFERSLAQQSRLWRSVFAALLLCFAGFLLYSIFQQVSSPWELRYHAYFMEEMSSWMIISADWVAVVACSLAIMGLLHESVDHRQWIWYSFSIGLVLPVFWLYYMLRMPRFRWDVIWLPFGPLSGAGICLYVDHLLSSSSEEIRRLRGHMRTCGVEFVLDYGKGKSANKENEMRKELLGCLKARRLPLQMVCSTR
ncbi:hypothetical protein FNV43_RR04668 [Rhamnella rubrinervis]|uniref:Uncharacterized protein n=1 Tax=Rhamnella rubrinervis TaxID=2594499 RepID=A0A8K0MPS5_9ROSA|nr:hypothetical protein FNV43_RR04668 [Rhamnella rubrinervis]